MDPEKQKLQNISKHVHSVLRTLKMGETGTVACSREMKPEELQLYMVAYAFHKRKWFEIKHDKVSNVLYAKRAAPPPWDHAPEEEESEEP